MTPIEIEALGQFLKIYHSDLKFIDEFSKFRLGKITIEEYHCDENKFGFRSFLKEYKVIRNIENNRTIEVLGLLKAWNFDHEQEELVTAISPICHGRQTRSLVSKIYFLNNPAKYYPMDALVLNALKLKTNDYNTYFEVLLLSKAQWESSVQKIIDSTENFTSIIENEFKKENLQIIRRNRVIDAFLWVVGSKQMKL